MSPDSQSHAISSSPYDGVSKFIFLVFFISLHFMTCSLVMANQCIMTLALVYHIFSYFWSPRTNSIILCLTRLSACFYWFIFFMSSFRPSHHPHLIHPTRTYSPQDPLCHQSKSLMNKMGKYFATFLQLK